ncbi:MAG: hypothetical protein EU549_03810, partial [Promethearchaeota archaeon]
MSNLYFANLGISNYDKDQKNAHYRLLDFINYIYLAKENEERQDFSINWKPLPHKIIEEIVKDKFLIELTHKEPYETY